MVSVGDVGVVGYRVDDVEGVGVDEVIAEACVEIGICCDRGHDIRYVCSSVNGLLCSVVCIEDSEFVAMSMAEECTTNSIVEAVDDLVVEI